MSWRNSTRISNTFFNSRHRRTKVFLVVVLLLIFIVLWFLVYLSKSCCKCYPKIDVEDNISCYNYVTPNHDLPLFQEADLGKRNIFFLETSCRRALDSRQACAIESAARSNPSRNVIVFFCAPVTKVFLQSAVCSTLNSFKNLKMFRIHVHKYVKDTPVEKLFEKHGKLSLSQNEWKISHASDILRFLTLYKYGGIYLDLDVIVLRSFDTLPRNWVVKQFDEELSSAMLSMSKNGTGRVFSDHAMREIQFDYNPGDWSYNGPGLMDRVIKKMCYKNYSCNGLKVFDQRLFNPIPWRNYKAYFMESTNNTKHANTGYTHHFWNKLSHDIKIPVPNSWYAELARMYCPAIYNLYDDVFGT